jgi:hypothetical protein
MFEGLKRLFGKPLETAPQDSASGSYSVSQNEPVVDKYFDLHAKIEAAKKAHDYRTAILYARQTYPLFPAFVEACKRQYKRFDIQSSVAVETGSILMAVMGDREGIAELRKALSGTSELQAWMGAAEKAEQDADVVDRILDLVSREPGVLQTNLKKRLATDDGRRLSTLVQWLGKARRLLLEREGKTYRLFPSSSPKSFAHTMKSVEAKPIINDPGPKIISIAATKTTEHGKARFRLPDQFEGYVEQVALHHLGSEGWNGLWGENHVWWTLMALLFWDVIFARIEGVWEPLFGPFPSKMQDMPQDLFRPEFFTRRERLITERLSILEVTDLNQELNRAYANHYGKPCRPIENWDKFSLSDLQNVVAHLDKSKLISILVRLLKNFNENRRGLPDLFIWKNADHAYAEVKGPGDKLSESQKSWFNALQALGETTILVKIE